MTSDMPAEFLKGIEEFNQQEFFQCHETLEELWKKQTEPERQLTQGIIQIAVGYYHLLRGNYEGSQKLLQRGLKRITPFVATCRYLDLAAFTTSVQAHLQKSQDSPSDSIIPPCIPLIHAQD